MPRTEWPDLDREAQEFTDRVEAVQVGGVPEGALWRRDDGLYRVQLAPMVEGAVGVEPTTPSTEGGSGGEEVAVREDEEEEEEGGELDGEAAAEGEGAAAHDPTEL